jgi:hypothetical protein
MLMLYAFIAFYMLRKAYYKEIKAFSYIYLIIIVLFIQI